jgi:hypothetical protein
MEEVETELKEKAEVRGFLGTDKDKVIGHGGEAGFLIDRRGLMTPSLALHVTLSKLLLDGRSIDEEWNRSSITRNQLAGMTDVPRKSGSEIPFVGTLVADLAKIAPSSMLSEL